CAAFDFKLAYTAESYAKIKLSFYEKSQVGQRFRKKPRIRLFLRKFGLSTKWFRILTSGKSSLRVLTVSFKLN
ncbi:MAG: hypothetical protein M3N42_10015, partial [Cyanobacteriota bacterium]|nr:hypothetical protein [Cyanobacteriota bacterium]